MLYQVGALTVDTFPFGVDAVDRDASADFAKKDLLGRIAGKEFVGEGDDNLRLSGQLLPFHIGGLDQLEVAHQMRRAGDPQYVMRGDGRPQGWFVIERVREQHKEIQVGGVGAVVNHEINLGRTDKPSPEQGAALISQILSLFG